MATENHVFVNRGLERQVRERQATRLSHAWTILKARFDTTTYYSNNPTLLSSFPKDNLRDPLPGEYYVASTGRVK